MDRISVTKFLRQYPNYQSCFGSQNWDIDEVGNSYDYDDSVCHANLYAYYAVFMELFIRKCLCTRFDIVCEDKRTLSLLRQQRIKNPHLKNELLYAYDAYTDADSKAIDIIEDIKMVALSHRIMHHGNMEFLDDIYDMQVNYRNLKEVVQFLNRLPYGYMVYKEPCEFEFDRYTLCGVPDYIFDGHVFCQIATSMYAGSYKKKFAKVLFYILSHYERNHYDDDEEIEYTIMMYNPLLGQTYTTYLTVTPWSYERVHDDIERDMDNLMDYNYYMKYIK